MSRYLSSSGYMVTVCAVVLERSTCCATRISIGLAVRFRSKCVAAVVVASADVREKGFDDSDELVLLEPSREPSRLWEMSCDSPECLRLSTFRGLEPAVGSLLDVEVDEAGAIVAKVMELPLPPIELRDCGFRSRCGCSAWSYEGRRRAKDCGGSRLGTFGCGIVRERS